MAWLQDVKQAGRVLRRAPGFTAIAVGVLALGIGANTAIFSLINAELLQPLPFRQPNQLVQLYETEGAPGSFPLSGPDFPDWQAQAKLFSGMTLYNYPSSLNLDANGAPERVIAQPAEANFFSLLGVKPALGRFFLPGEDAPAKNQVAVLSHELWQSRFAGDPGVLGRKLDLNGEAYTVVGVAPPGFRLASPVEVWTPLDMRDLGIRGNHSYSAIGRLRPGVTLAQAQAEISAIAARLAQRYPDSNATTGAKIYWMRDRLVRAPQRAMLWTLLAVVGMVLLIACANVSNLLLARALERQKEISIRLAIGASPGQILRQLLTESVALALAGAALGAALAWAAVRGLVSLSAFTLPRFNAIAVNGPVLAFTLALAVICGILFGVAPAWQLARARLGDLNGAGALASGAGGAARKRLREGLIVGEIALSMLLLVAAGLLLKSFARQRGADLGFQPAGVLTASLSLPRGGYPGIADDENFQRRFLDRLQAIPGVRAASASSELPLEGGSNGYIELPGDTDTRKALVEWTYATPSYFQTMQIPILEGRGFDAADADGWRRFDALVLTALAANQAPAPAQSSAFHLNVVVNQALARNFFAGTNPLGRRFRQGGDGPWLTIVGVARDVPIFDLGGAAMAQAYFPDLPFGRMIIELRSSLPPAALAAQVRRTLAGLDSTLPLYSVRTMNQVADGAVGGAALEQRLVGLFAGLALLLAAAGLYGALSLLVASRTREIGLRMALGATRGDVLAMILRRGLGLALAGIACGLVAALFAGRLLASQLYDVRAADPAVLLAAAAVLLASALAACTVPALRAAGVDPNQALRVD